MLRWSPRLTKIRASTSPGVAIPWPASPPMAMEKSKVPEAIESLLWFSGETSPVSRFRRCGAPRLYFRRSVARLWISQERILRSNSTLIPVYHPRQRGDRRGRGWYSCFWEGAGGGRGRSAHTPAPTGRRGERFQGRLSRAGCKDSRFLGFARNDSWWGHV